MSIVGLGQLYDINRRLLQGFGSAYIMSHITYRESWVMIGVKGVGCEDIVSIASWPISGLDGHGSMINIALNSYCAALLNVCLPL